MKDEMTTKEAADALGVARSTISSYVSRGILTATRIGHVTRSSVEEHKENRNEANSHAAKLSRSPVSIRHLNQKKTTQRIYGFVLWWWSVHGTPPSYDMIAPHIPIAKSGIHRYMDDLLKEGKVQITDYRVYLRGLPEKIAELIRKEYADDISKNKKPE